jgi:senataxin
MSDVGESVQRGLEIVANLPEEAHWLCDRIEPSPSGRQVIVEEDEELRADSTMHAMLLLSFTDQENSQAWVKGRIAEQLARCSRCVESFYALKRRLHKMLLPEHGEENVNQFFHYLEEWDIERVSPVLSDIMADLDRSLSPDEWYLNLRRDRSRYNTLYECLCSPGLLQWQWVYCSLSSLSSVYLSYRDAYDSIRVVDRYHFLPNSRQRWYALSSLLLPLYRSSVSLQLS